MVFWKNGKPQANDDDDRMSAMEGAIAQMSAAVAEMARGQQRFGSMLTGVMTREQPQPQVQPQTPTQVKLPALPHPMDNPDGFAHGLSERVIAQAAEAAKGIVDRTVGAQQSAQAEAQARAEFLSGMEEEFREEYPDLAGEDNEDLIEQVTGQVIARYKRRGLDPLKAAQADPDGFMEQVAVRARKHLAAVAAETGDQDPDAAVAAEYAEAGHQSQMADGLPSPYGNQNLNGHAPARPKARGKGDRMDNLRAQVMGGDTGQLPTRGKGKGKPEEAPDWTTSILAEQKRLRIY